MFFLLQYSCKLSSDIQNRQNLIEENSFYINGKKIIDNQEYKNLILTNENYKVFGFPIGLYLNQEIEENPNVFFDTIIKKNPKKYYLLESIFSKKAINKLRKNYIGINEKIKEEYSEEPILLNEDDVIKSREKIENYFAQNGYLDVKCKTQIKTQTKNTHIEYDIETGQKYSIRDIKLLTKSPEIEIAFKEYELKIKRGDSFEYSILENERQSISNFFRDKGFYFFDISRVLCEIDTISSEKRMDLYIRILEKEEYTKDSIIYKNHNRYKISDIKIFTDYKFDTTNNIYQVVSFKDYNILYNTENEYNQRVITNNILYSRGDYYSNFKDNQTRIFFNRLNNFRSVDTRFIVDTLSKELNAEIRLLPSSKYWINYDILASRSNILEFGLEFSLLNGIRNLADMADVFQISLSGTIGNYRGFLNSGFLNSFIFNTNLSWTFPIFIFPFSEKLDYVKRIRPRTEYKLGYNFQKNIGLDRRDFSFSISTIWNENEYKEHKIIFPYFRNTKYENTQNYFNFYVSEKNKINSIYSKINGRDIPSGSNYQEIITELMNLNQNSNDYKTLSDVAYRYNVFTSNMFIPSIKYVYTYNNLQRKLDWTLFKLELESSGDLFIPILKGLNLLKYDSIVNNDTFFGVPISSYMKIDINFVKYIKLSNDYSYLAFKSFIGVGVPLGKTRIIPYQEMYFSGGTNNERAWLAYDLGPGGNKEKLFSLNVADIKLSFSLEYRFTIYKSLKGALFVDAGNIWRYNSLLTDSKLDLEVFKWDRFYREFAVGVGYGLRYDMDIFIVRLDMAYKMIDPSKDEGSRYVLGKQDIFSPTFQFGITYPF